MMLVLLVLVMLLTVTTYFYMKRPQFGALPEGKRWESIQKSPHFKEGRFRNLVEMPVIAEGYSMPGEIFKTLFKKFPNREPVDSLPSVKTDLRNAPRDSDMIVWFGHSSFFLQLDGVRFLVDPVFSGKASPLPGGVKAYKGSDVYTAADMPDIDYMLLSHDHYDHLDFETAVALKDRVKFVICGLGAGAHYEKWGYRPEQIIEKDWYDQQEIKPGFTIFTESTHHDSGRGFTRGQSLWLSFYIRSPRGSVYYSGDGGYDGRFQEIFRKHGAPDWAIMECGQYNEAWHSVHELPEEVAKATEELHAGNLLTVHHSKFTLANHPWNEPLEKISAYSQNKPYRLVTPMIGEPVRLHDHAQQFEQWWKKIQ
ncbi:MBL fold metallo-hydrolase [Chitinophaga caseinilytica]|uniref:MBL fold metallo-hydrolase n=1 Tax=Chitinophaga caseinilytica TaxID=2267521 RepID=A0ABZ2Z3K0_9BACT